MYVSSPCASRVAPPARPVMIVELQAAKQDLLFTDVGAINRSENCDIQQGLAGWRT